MFNNIHELLELFPHYEEASNGEYHTPCPFCGKGVSTTYKGVKFYGEDRLVWYADGKGVHCRQEGKYRPIEKVAEFFGGEISADFDMVSEGATAEEKEAEAPVIASPAYVAQCHETVDRAYWYRNHWTDETINRFKLGYGGMYPYSTKAPRHLIPMQCQHEGDPPLIGYSFEGRYIADKSEPPNIKTKGLTKGWFWYIEDDPGSKTIAITEGPKDAITLWQSGYKNFAAIFGSGGFTPGIAEFLKTKGYENIVVFGDNDEAGDKFNRSVIRQFFPVKVNVLEWPESTPEKYDVTDALVDGKLTRLLQENFSEQRSKGFIHDYTDVEPDYSPDTPETAMSRDAIRAELPLVISDYLDNYKDRKKQYGKGVVKVLAAPPGVGKSYIMVQAAQERARLVLDDKEHNLELLEQKIIEVEEWLQDPDLDELERAGYEAQLERLRKKTLRVNKILYAGPFIAGWHDIQTQPNFDSTLWFNYEARNEENCQNLEAVSAIASKGYNARAFCETSCPMRDWCMEQGYLSQEEKRKEKPITYVRHQHLEGGVVQGSTMIFLDEEPFHVFEKDMEIRSSDIRPVYEADWQDFVEPEQVALINELVGTLKATIEGTQEELSGYDVLAELDKRCGNKLVDILHAIDPDVLDAYQPASGFVVSDAKEAASLPQRCFADIYEVLASEIGYYRNGQRRYNTRISIQRNRFRIFRVDKLIRPKSHPIIVADATAMAPDLYGLLMDRAVEVYKPEVWSPKAHTKVFYGSDFTRTSIRQQIGPAITLMNKYVEDTIVHDIFGEPFDLTTIPVDENMYDSAILNQAMTLLKDIAADHENLLIITYKPIRLLMERKVQQVYPDLNVRFAHYGSLRGTNVYKDMEAVLLIGAHRLPYEHLYRRAQAWAQMAEYHKPLDPTVVMKTAPYHGRLEGYTYYGFADEFADQFVDLAEVGEIQQALDRIRLFTSDTDKYAYLALSRPAAKWVGELKGVYSYTNFLNNTKHQDMTAYISEQWELNGKAPTYRHLVETFKVSRRNVKEAMDEVKEKRQKQRNKVETR